MAATQTLAADSLTAKGTLAAPRANLVLYDGVCGLCNRSVRFLLRIDRRGVLAFAPLQGPTAARLAERHGFPETAFGEPESSGLRTIVYVRRFGLKHERAHLRSDAVLRILGDVGGPWSLFGIFRLVPRFLRDPVYDWVARHRYQWFGKLDQCPLPPPEQRARFLPVKQYLDLLAHVLAHGVPKSDRTGTGTLSTFGWQMRFDLAQGFPLLTTKKLHLRSIVHELLWFVRGETNVRSLQAEGVKIWDEWADAEGDLGPIYGRQWRAWGTADGRRVDQLAQVVAGLRRDPDSRRHLVSAWNVGELPAMRLAPCHVLFQFWVGGDRLSLQLYQRSGDVFLGVPFNIASYALLLTMVAQVTGYAPGELVHTLGDAHLYVNHLEQARLQLERAPRPLPRLRLEPTRRELDEFRFADVVLEGYEPHPHIPAAVAV